MKRNMANQIWATEKFKVQILGGDGLSYDYKRAAPSKMTVSQWLKMRGNMSGFEAKVLNGNNEPVHGRCTLKYVRSTYL